MQKQVSPEGKNALDNAGNSKAFGGDDPPESLIQRPILGPLKRKPPCVFITIATPT
jgi:hypothetical protein